MAKFRDSPRDMINGTVVLGYADEDQDKVVPFFEHNENVKETCSFSVDQSFSIIVQLGIED